MVHRPDYRQLRWHECTRAGVERPTVRRLSNKAKCLPRTSLGGTLQRSTGHAMDCAAAKNLESASQAESAHKRAISLDVLRSQVLEQTSLPTNLKEQATSRVVVVLVSFKMLGERLN